MNNIGPENIYNSEENRIPANNGNGIVVCRGLSKSYHKVPALKDINLIIPSGKIIGLLGPNGSGKTTFIKTVAGLLTPTSGEIYIDGKAPSHETKAIVSYLPERTYFNKNMYVSETIDYFAEFYKDFDRSRAEAMIDDLGIRRDARLRTLSKGTCERAQLILVMSRRAKLYLLDEPIGGVDPAARDYILSTIISNYDPGAAVIISTHLIADVEKILDDFMFIDRGNIAAYGNVDDVRENRGMSLDEYFRSIFTYERGTAR
ncbi:MAG: ABC transporter ATP-binding protein [Clostridia bacterium]|nr:ABC transporter ATP-binding protein [Clostridia bacterium]